MENEIYVRVVIEFILIVIDRKLFHRHYFLYCVRYSLSDRKKYVCDEIRTVSYINILFVGYEPNHIEVLDTKSTLIILFYCSQKHKSMKLSITQSVLLSRMHYWDKYCGFCFNIVQMIFVSQQICFESKINMHTFKFQKNYTI